MCKLSGLLVEQIQNLRLALAFLSHVLQVHRLLVHARIVCLHFTNGLLSILALVSPLVYRFKLLTHRCCVAFKEDLTWLHRAKHINTLLIVAILPEYCYSSVVFDPSLSSSLLNIQLTVVGQSKKFLALGYLDLGVDARFMLLQVIIHDAVRQLVLLASVHW